MTASKQLQATRIGPSGRAALQLLACCPRMPTNVVGVLLGHRQAVTTAQLLARLRRGGLAQDQASRLGPLLGSRPVHLWTLTADGRAFLASRGPSPTPEGAGQMRYGEPERWRDPARQRDVPAARRLLPITRPGGHWPRSARARVYLGASVDPNHHVYGTWPQAAGTAARSSGAGQPQH